MQVCLHSEHCILSTIFLVVFACVPCIHAYIGKGCATHSSSTTRRPSACMHAFA